MPKGRPKHKKRNLTPEDRARRKELLKKARARPRKKAPVRSPVVSDQVDQFCIHLKFCKSIRKAAFRAGFHPSSGYYLLQRPDVQQRLREIDEAAFKQNLTNTIEETKAQRLAGADTGDEILLGAVADNKATVGEKLRAAVILYKTHGLIQDSRTGTKVFTNAQAGVQANGVPQLTIDDPIWLQQKEARMVEALKEKYGDIDPADHSKP